MVVSADLVSSELGAVTAYGFNRTPISNAAPFTYREGATYLSILEGLVEFVNEKHIPQILAIIKEIERILDEGIENWEERITEKINEFDVRVTEAIADMVAANQATVEQFEAIVELINNKTGPIDIQRATLVDNSYVLTVPSIWPTNHRVEFVLTQDEVGNHTVTLDDMIVGELPLNKAANGITNFSLIPMAGGMWKIIEFGNEWKTYAQDVIPYRTTNGISNHTDMLEEYLLKLKDGQAEGGLTPGIYWISRGLVVDGNAILKGWGGGTRRFGQDAFNYSPVVIRRAPGATFTEPLITLKGAGSGIVNIHVEGTGNPELDVSPGIVAQGFETTIDNVRVLNVANIGIDVQRANNTRWGRIYIDNCGRQNLAGMKVWSKSGVGHANETNTLDIDLLTIESCEGPHLDIGWPPAGQENNPEYYVEFVRLGVVHLESSNRNARSGTGVGNVGFAAIRAGNVRTLIFMAMFGYAGPGPLFEHKQTNQWKPWGMGGITFLGGTALGADVGAGVAPSEYLFKLSAGNGFRIIGMEGYRHTQAMVRVEPTYGVAAYIDSSVRSFPYNGGTGAIMDDARPFPTRYTIHGKLAPLGALRFNGKPSTLKMTSGGVTNVSFKAGSNDAKGVISFDITNAGIGKLLEIEFGQVLELPNPTLNLTPIDGASSRALLHGGASSTGWVLYAAATPTPNTENYQVNYSIME